MAAWWEPQVGGYFLRADCVAQIVADITTYITTTPDGKKTLDTAGLMTLAATRLAAIPGPPPNFVYDTPDLLHNANVYPYVDSLRVELGAIAGQNSSSGGADLQPLLEDLKAKSDAVTAFYAKLYDVSLPDLLTQWLSSGELFKDVPEPDDLTKETRYWRLTWVSDREEEGAPSEVSDPLEVGTKDTVTITRPSVPASRNISYWRPYRSNSGNENAEFQYVPNATSALGVAQATSTLVDDVPNSKLQEVCPSTIWAEPPSNLAGIIALANGIHLGWFGRTLCPSETNIPHAWPVEYRRTVNDVIVGGCAFGQGAFIGTTGRPCWVSGVDAAHLSISYIDTDHACVSARSICATSDGVIYAAANGLCLAAPGAPVRVITQEHFTREEWQATDPANLIVQEHDGVIYFGKYDAPAGSATDPYIASVKSLLHFEGANGSTTITDVMGKTWAVAGNGQLSTTTPIAGTSSLLLDGTGDDIHTAHHADWNIETLPDFTFEMTIRRAVTGVSHYLISKRLPSWFGPTASEPGYELRINADDTLQFYMAGGSSVTTSATVPAGVDTHIAVSCNSSVIRLFIGGAKVGIDKFNPGNVNTTDTFKVGTSNTSADAFNGRIDEFRFTRGVGRYTDAFAPPPTPYPDA